MKKALIIGSEGQDGTLLKKVLHSKKYQVHGIGRSQQKKEDELSSYLYFDLHQDNYEILNNYIQELKPDEIYYVAAFHHSSQDNSINASFDFIEHSIKVNQTGFIHTLEIVKNSTPNTKVFYTSSSLVFSGSRESVQSETTVTEPRCIYSVTKSAATDAAKYYAAAFGIFVSVGIMYNHESIFRKDYFLSKKIVNETKWWLEKKITKIKVGDLSAVTDWGYALDYAEAMWHILQQEKPGIYVISSGQGRQVKEWFEVLSNYLKLDWKDFVEEDPSLMIRKKPVLIGNNSKLLASGWKPKVSFEEMVIRMYNNTL